MQRTPCSHPLGFWPARSSSALELVLPEQTLRQPGFHSPYENCPEQSVPPTWRSLNPGKKMDLQLTGYNHGGLWERAALGGSSSVGSRSSGQREGHTCRHERRLGCAMSDTARCSGPSWAWICLLPTCALSRNHSGKVAKAHQGHTWWLPQAGSDIHRWELP